MDKQYLFAHEPDIDEILSTLYKSKAHKKYILAYDFSGQESPFGIFLYSMQNDGLIDIQRMNYDISIMLTSKGVNRYKKYIRAHFLNFDRILTIVSVLVGIAGTIIGIRGCS